MSGISAGANCWFEHAYSDSTQDKEYDFVDGLGFIKGVLCPHYNRKKRRDFFEEEIKNNKYNFKIAYGIEENHAIIINDDVLIGISENGYSNDGVHIINFLKRKN